MKAILHLKTPLQEPKAWGIAGMGESGRRRHCRRKGRAIFNIIPAQIIERLKAGGITGFSWQIDHNPPGEW